MLPITALLYGKHSYRLKLVCALAIASNGKNKSNLKSVPSRDSHVGELKYILCNYFEVVEKFCKCNTLTVDITN